MTFNLDPNKPIYQQVAQQILQDIKEGKLRPGDRLPTDFSLQETKKKSKLEFFIKNSHFIFFLLFFSKNSAFS